MWLAWYLPAIVVVGALLLATARAHDLWRRAKAVRRDAEALRGEVAATARHTERIPRLRTSEGTAPPRQK